MTGQRRVREWSEGLGYVAINRCTTPRGVRERREGLVCAIRSSASSAITCAFISVRSVGGITCVRAYQRGLPAVLPLLAECFLA